MDQTALGLMIRMLKQAFDCCLRRSHSMAVNSCRHCFNVRSLVGRDCTQAPGIAIENFLYTEYVIFLYYGEGFLDRLCGSRKRRRCGAYFMPKTQQLSLDTHPAK